MALTSEQVKKFFLIHNWIAETQSEINTLQQKLGDLRKEKEHITGELVRAAEGGQAFYQNGDVAIFVNNKDVSIVKAGVSE